MQPTHQDLSVNSKSSTPTTKLAILLSVSIITLSVFLAAIIMLSSA